MSSVSKDVYVVARSNGCGQVCGKFDIGQQINKKIKLTAVNKNDSSILNEYLLSNINFYKFRISDTTKNYPTKILDNICLNIDNFYFCIEYDYNSESTETKYFITCYYGDKHEKSMEDPILKNIYLENPVHIMYTEVTIDKIPDNIDRVGKFVVIYILNFLPDLLLPDLESQIKDGDEITEIIIE